MCFSLARVHAGQYGFFGLCVSRCVTDVACFRNDSRVVGGNTLSAESSGSSAFITSSICCSSGLSSCASSSCCDGAACIS